MLKLIAALVLALTPALARADDCAGRTVEALHTGSYDWVELRWVEGSVPGWLVRTTPAPGKIGEWKVLGCVDQQGDVHAHLTTFAPQSRQRFLVVDTNAEHLDKPRIRLFDKDGNLLRIWHFADFLTKEEIARLDLSISHVHWLEGRPTLDGDTAVLKLKTGKTLKIDLAAASPALRIE